MPETNDEGEPDATGAQLPRRAPIHTLSFHDSPNTMKKLEETINSPIDQTPPPSQPLPLHHGSIGARE